MDLKNIIELKEEMDGKINNLRFSVIDKILCPASGDKHDYYSLAIYWWPNPDTDTGFPYIWKDGQPNPQTKTYETDSVRIEDFSNSIMILANLFQVFKEEKYLKKIEELLEIWFLREETKMNPNMNYSKGVPGKSEGRGNGIIDSRHFLKILNHIEVLEEKKLINKKIIDGLKQWFEEFVFWLQNSSHGKEEEAKENNHGLWYEAQIVTFATFIGNEEVLRERAQKFLIKLRSQITEEGEQWHETKRTKPWHYSIFNLEAIMHSYKNLKKIKDMKEEQELIERAVDYLISHILNEKKWNKQEDKDFRNKDLRERKILPLLWDLSKENKKYKNIFEAINKNHGLEEFELAMNTQNDYKVLFPLKK